jgi:hypothetical protein
MSGVVKSGMFKSWVIVQFGGIALILHLKQHQLQPLLAGLPRSNERLFPAIKPAEGDAEQIIQRLTRNPEHGMRSRNTANMTHARSP